jgi:hypothetical protein
MERKEKSEKGGKKEKRERGQKLLGRKRGRGFAFLGL